MKAIEFATNLKGVPAHLRVEAQPEGGWLSQCPSCAPCPGVGLSLSFNQLGDDLVVRCFGGCSDETLVESLYYPGDGMEVITWNQWLEREVKRGHSKDYLQAQLREALPLPKALCSSSPKALTFDALMSMKIVPRAELCGPWLKERTLAEVYGWRGAGKSWFGLSLAYAVAAGVALMRWSVPEARGVLYVDGEMDLEDIQLRLSLIHKSEQKRAGRQLSPKLRYLADGDLEQFPNGLPKLSTPEGRALVEAHLDGVSLVVLDNLSTLYNSGIENDAESWVEAQDWLVSLRRRGISVVFVHHAGKGGQQRGTSKREDICDTVIALKKPEEHQAEDGCAFTLTFEKNRGAKGPAVAPFSAKLTQDEDGDLIWALQDSKEERGAQIRALFDEGISIRQIGKMVGLSHSNVSRYLSKTNKAGEVVRGAPPRRGGAHHDTNPAHHSERTSAPPAHHSEETPFIERISISGERTTKRTSDAPASQVRVVRHPNENKPAAHHSRTTEQQDSGRLLEARDEAIESQRLPLTKTYFNGAVSRHLNE